jgi:hypothetical protein
VLGTSVVRSNPLRRIKSEVGVIEEYMEGERQQPLRRNYRVKHAVLTQIRASFTGPCIFREQSH